MSAETVQLLIPEIVLLAVAVLIYMGGAFVDSQKAWSWLAGGGILLAAIALYAQGEAPSAGPVAADSLGLFARWLALAAGGLFVLLTSRPLAGGGTPEYVGSLMLAVAGLMLACCARELVLLFLGLELISIPTYILLFLGRRDGHSQEAAAKYFFLSILASAMVLYGFAFLYGATGTTDLGRMHERLDVAYGLQSVFGLLAMILILAGLGFKVAAVPFHFYAPDVYQGTTHANAAILSVMPKAAGLIVLGRIVVLTMPSADPHIVVVLAVLTMTFGNLMALWQQNVRRLLAYSSVAHAGYMLIGLAVALGVPGGSEGPGGFNGLGAMLFYLCVYAVATIGTFAALDYLGRRDAQLDGVDELAGLGRSRPLAAAAVAVFMFSLAGIPPLAGFWGKLTLFLGALGVDRAAAAGESWFVALAVIGVLNAAVAAAYYLRIVAVMYFRTPLAAPKAQGGAGKWCAVVACAVLTIALGLMPRPLLNESNRAGARQQIVPTAEPIDALSPPLARR